MTTLGLTIAREQRYDSVPADGEFHEALLGTDKDDIFEALLAGRKPDAKISRPETKRDLGQLAITLAGVNFEALRPEDIPEGQLTARRQLLSPVRQIQLSPRTGIRNTAS